MRILAIRGQNLASLARSFEIDLVNGPLANAGLFAITGPVGAGKSTLLDALCLPLFDRTPRLSGRGGALVGDDGESPTDWLRANDPRTLLRRDAASGHAEVDFIGRDGVRYRATWSVRRARRRADGRVQEQELQLTDLDRTQVIASGRRSEVLAAIAQRLGLDFGQFCRSVLLAQGDFAAFLKASADERAKLLETLTGADIYRRLSRAAHERARAKTHEVALLRAQIDAQPPLAEDVRTTLERALAQWQSQLQTCAIGIALASRYVTWHDAAARHRHSESDATVKLDAAIDAHSAAAPRRLALERRQRAMAVVPRWEVMVYAQAAVRAVRGKWTTAQQQFAACGLQADALRQRLATALQAALGQMATVAVPALVRDLPQWEALLQQWQQSEAAAAREMKALAAKETAVETATRAMNARNSQLQDAADAVSAASAAVKAAEAGADACDGEGLAARRREAQVQRDATTRLELLVKEWRAAITTAQAATDRCSALAIEQQQWTTELAACTARHVEASSARDRALERADAARTQAGLAPFRSKLVAGEPCPLCGASEHPAPLAHDDVGTQRALGELTARELDLAAAVGELARVRGEQKATLAQMEWVNATQVAGVEGVAQAVAAWALASGTSGTAANGDVEVAAYHATAAVAELAALATQIELEDSSARKAMSALQAAVRTATKAQTTWSAADAQQKTAADQHQQAVTARAAAHARIETERQRLGECQAALAGACLGLANGVATIAAIANDRLAVLRQLHALHHQHAAAQRSLADAAQVETQASAVVVGAEADERTAAAALVKALAIATVAIDDVAAAAQSGADALAAEAEALRAFDAEVARLRAVLQERVNQRKLHEDHDQPSLDAVEAARALADARNAADAVQRKEQDLRVQLGADDLVRRHRAEIAPRLDAGERALQLWQGLDDLIGSSTGDAFAVFAQELTLDLLLLEANRRLSELARRYRLHKNVGGELEFVVVDLDLGGSRRSLQTLSGGETFLVSLALALALATLAAPKSRVETLFLDEGFGTLDAHSLEVALGALDSLQATGCQVGVISHVEGIAERIGAQVVVQPEGGGQSRVFAQAR